MGIKSWGSETRRPERIVRRISENWHGSGRDGGHGHRQKQAGRVPQNEVDHGHAWRLRHSRVFWLQPHSQRSFQRKQLRVTTACPGPVVAHFQKNRLHFRFAPSSDLGRLPRGRNASCDHFPLNRVGFGALDVGTSGGRTVRIVGDSGYGRASQPGELNARGVGVREKSVYSPALEFDSTRPENALASPPPVLPEAGIVEFRDPHTERLVGPLGMDPRPLKRQHAESLQRPKPEELDPAAFSSCLGIRDRRSHGPGVALPVARTLSSHPPVVRHTLQRTARYGLASRVFGSAPRSATTIGFVTTLRRATRFAAAKHIEIRPRAMPVRTDALGLPCCSERSPARCRERALRLR